MWMIRFDLSDVVEPEELGLNENKCALVFNEKLGVMKTMLGIIDFMDFQPSLVPGNPGTGKEKRTRGAADLKDPAAQRGTQGRKSQKSPSVTEKQMPLEK